MNGIEALVCALRAAGVQSVYAVPGYPITELAEHVIEHMRPRARWVISEKSAFEMAFGGSVSGRRTCVITKHVGLNVLSDPLITSATHTIGAGLVVITGDDPLALGSQNEQDSRYYGLLAEVPVFDPNPHNPMYSALPAHTCSQSARGRQPSSG